jgi:hypothetical protein
LHLEVAPWLQRLESLANDLGWVFETSEKSTAMDKIKLITQDPFIFRVIDLKAAVRRNALSY